jgi:hypothetical protein
MPSGFQESAHGVFQHHLSGTGYRQSPTQAEEVSMRELSIPHAKKVRASAPIR